ncbi:MAG: class I SAM-dependent methyltransferase, partial [Geminicoccaceae bacterium]
MKVGPASWRRLHLGVRTLVGRRPGGFFIPYRHACDVVPVGYASLEPLFAAALPEMLRRLAEIEGLADALRGLTGPPPRP